MKCLEPEDVAASVVHVLSAPAYCGIVDVLMFPVEQEYSGGNSNVFSLGTMGLYRGSSRVGIGKYPGAHCNPSASFCVHGNSSYVGMKIQIRSYSLRFTQRETCVLSACPTL